MASETASSEEFIVRCALHPRIMEAGLISAQKMLQPGLPSNLADGVRGIALSVAAKSMLRDEEHMHDFGCRAADRARTRKQQNAQKKGKTLKRPEQTVHYVGSLELAVSAVTEMKSDYFTFRVVEAGGKDFEEHYHLEWCPIKDGWDDEDNDEAAAEKTDIIDKLFSLLHRPRAHICECDRDLEELLQPICDAIVEHFPEENPAQHP